MEDDIKLAADIIAVQQMLSWAMNEIYLLKEMSANDIQNHERGFISQLKLESFPWLDPAMSDAFSAEIESSVQSIFDGAALQRGR